MLPVAMQLQYINKIRVFSYSYLSWCNTELSFAYFITLNEYWTNFRIFLKKLLEYFSFNYKLHVYIIKVNVAVYLLAYISIWYIYRHSFFFKCWVASSDTKYKNDYEDLSNFDLMQITFPTWKKFILFLIIKDGSCKI